MAIRFAPADDSSFATLYVVDRTLQWQYSSYKATRGLLIKSNYGVIPDLRKIEIRDAIANAYEHAGGTDSFAIPEIGVGYIVKDRSFHAPNESATYSIFAITYNNNELIVRYPTRNDGDSVEDIIRSIQFSQNLRQDVGIRVELNKMHFFDRTASLKVSFSKVDAYKDGTIFYRVGGASVKYPITESLLRGFYVQASDPAELQFFTTDASICLRML